MTFALDAEMQPPGPLRIWLNNILPSASVLSAYARFSISTAARKQLARVAQLRNSQASLYDAITVEVAGGFLTVIALDNDVHFVYHEDGSPTDPDPLPPKPRLMRFFVQLC